MVPFDEEAFLSTDMGELLRVTTDKLSIVSTPGFCETIARSSSGELLAVFRNEGVFAYRSGEWKRLFPYPLPRHEEVQDVFLTEEGGRLALATRSVPGEVVHGTEVLWTGTVSLWISERDKLVPLYRDGRWEQGVLGDGSE